MHRVLVIGVGSIGERHLRCFQATGRAELSLCEVNAELRQQVAGRYNVQQAFGDFEQAVASRPEVAVICTPAHLHIAMAQKLADAGVHLLVEKPLSTSLDGVEQLIATVEKKQLTAAVAYVLRATPALQAMKAAIDSGRFGQPRHLVAVSGQHFPLYRPAYRQIYYTSRATGGGAIQDALTHLMNAGQYLAGPITQMMADAAHQVLEGVTVEDTVNVLARQGQVLSSYSLNQFQAPNESSVMVACERGAVKWELHTQRWMWVSEPGGPWQVETSPPTERDSMFVAQAQAMLDAVEGKAPPLCTLAEGLATLKANLAALAASDQPAWVTL